MKTKLMLASLLAFAAIAQAGPPISPAKIKKPLRISQIKSIFPQAPPSAPAAPAGTAAGGSATTAGSAGTAASSAAAPVAEPKISKRAKARPFLNHPVTAPGPH